MAPRRDPLPYCLLLIAFAALFKALESTDAVSAGSLSRLAAGGAPLAPAAEAMPPAAAAPAAQRGAVPLPKASPRPPGREPAVSLPRPMPAYVVRHREPGWRDEWTVWLREAVVAYQAANKRGEMRTWADIGMARSFTKIYCPAYNVLPEDGPASEDRLAFLIEVFKAVAYGESQWNTTVVNPRNPTAQGLYQMSPGDMRHCTDPAKGERNDPFSPKDAIRCAVKKLMPIFFWKKTFAGASYSTPKGRRDNFFEVLYPKWEGKNPLGVSPLLHRKLKERVSPASFPACFQY